MYPLLTYVILCVTHPLLFFEGTIVTDNGDLAKSKVFSYMRARVCACVPVHVYVRCKGAHEHPTRQPHHALAQALRACTHTKLRIYRSGSSSCCLQRWIKGGRALHEQHWFSRPRREPHTQQSLLIRYLFNLTRC